MERNISLYATRRLPLVFVKIGAHSSARFAQVYSSIARTRRAVRARYVRFKELIICKHRWIDNVMVYSFQTKDLASGYPRDNSPHYYILNTALGGGYPGNPDSTTILPNYHCILRYMRYAQKPIVINYSDFRVK